MMRGECSDKCGAQVVSESNENMNVTMMRVTQNERMCVHVCMRVYENVYVCCVLRRSEG